MKIQFVSDLHLEFPENKNWLNKHPLPAIAETLILAGDIMPLHQLSHHSDFLNFLSDHFKQVFWVPGNHEYYYYDLSEYSHACEWRLRNNVCLINNKTLMMGDIRFVFSTLWTHIPESDAPIIEKHLSDFYLIQYQNKPFDASLYNSLHKQSVQYVTNELTDAFSQAHKTVVVTHHVPTLLQYPPKYAGSALNPGFAVELSEMIQTTSPHFWIYGHHHCNVKSFQLAQTQMLTNQLGYVRYHEHAGFQPELCIDII